MKEVTYARHSLERLSKLRTCFFSGTPVYGSAWDTVHFHMFHKKDQSRVKEVWYCVQEDKPLDRTDIEKGYGIGEGKYVVVKVRIPGHVNNDSGGM